MLSSMQKCPQPQVFFLHYLDRFFVISISTITRQQQLIFGALCLVRSVLAGVLVFIRISLNCEATVVALHVPETKEKWK